MTFVPPMSPAKKRFIYSIPSGLTAF
jgi:hypothetical protein